MKEVENSLDSQLWHACAGGMVQMPSVGSIVFHFPQGHAEHALTDVDFGGLPGVPPLIRCRVAAVKFMADPETDEVYAKMRLIPIGTHEQDYDEDAFLGNNASESAEKPTSFAKTLTQSDANNGGGFSVPRYCAETIFPPLDYTADPPVQTVIAKDVHGEVWKFRHIYRGTPRRHLLTTGWSTFVNQKKLVAGDSIVFMRAETGELCVGIRRAKRGGIGGSGESSCGWSSAAGNCVPTYGGFSVFLRDDESRFVRSGGSNVNLNSSGGFRGRGKISPESVIEATSLAANGQPFEVVYYPRANTPEFCVKASSLSAAMRIQWCAGMRFKMAFETEDSSRISWFMGTVASAQVADPIRWPNSPWRLLHVAWDEPDLLQNVKCVSPWLVELVSSMPVIHLSPFSPPRKKFRLPLHPDFPLDGQFPIPSFTNSPFCCLTDNVPAAGIQGARHNNTQFGVPLSDLHHPTINLHPPPVPLTFNQRPKIPDNWVGPTNVNNEDVSCLLTMGQGYSSHKKSEKSTNDVKAAARFILFGQPILTEQQISGNVEKTEMPLVDWKGFRAAELGLDTGHCKVFLQSEDVGRSLDLSALGSYEELYRRLANMFGIEKSDLLNRVLYRDSNGSVKQAGDEPFSEFTKTTKRLTIIMDSASNNVARNWSITGMRNAEHGLDSSSQTGPLSIFA